MSKQNSNLHKAKKEKNDEFYTMIEDVEKELSNYDLKDKIVYCNCDTEQSAFVRYFESREDIKELIYTHTDFRSEENIENMKRADVVITNPPFSLFREYVAQLMEHDKKFLIVGSMNAITYKEIFPLIKDDRLWLGINNVKEFVQPNGETKKFGNINWYTNLNHNKRNEKIDCFKEYSEKNYPKYDNYDAINVDKTKDIPAVYDGEMGVPISFLSRYNPEQFEIVRFRKGDDGKDLRVNGKDKYFRILIRRRTI